MGEPLQPPAHLVHLPLDGSPDLDRESVKGTGERGRPDLEGCRHSGSRLAGGVVAGGNLATGLIQPFLDLVRQLELVL